MRTFTRNGALTSGLVLVATFSFGATPARAQYRQPSAPTTYVVPSRSVVPVIPRYSSPSYYHQNGFFHPVRDARGAAYTSHYGYEPARRDLKLYKPWLTRD